MITVRFQPVGKDAPKMIVPQELQSPFPFKVDDHFDYHAEGRVHHLVVVSIRYVVSGESQGFHQLLGVAPNAG